jgi:hypothetical protein
MTGAKVKIDVIKHLGFNALRVVFPIQHCWYFWEGKKRNSRQIKVRYKARQIKRV